MSGRRAMPRRQASRFDGSVLDPADRGTRFDAKASDAQATGRLNAMAGDADLRRHTRGATRFFPTSSAGTPTAGPQRSRQHTAPGPTW